MVKTMALAENQLVFFYLVIFSICLTNIYVYIHTVELVSTLVRKTPYFGFIMSEEMV